VVGAERVFCNSQRALVKRLGFSILALNTIEPRQVIQALRYIRIV
jgi:hypothetical protein